MKTILFIWLVLYPCCAYSGDMDIKYAYNFAALTASNLPRVDILKAEVSAPEGFVGVSVSALAIRYGDWRYSVQSRFFDRWGNQVGDSLSNAKSNYLVDGFPIGIYLLQHSWSNESGKSGDIRLFYELSSTWLNKDNHNISANCDYGDNSLGNRTIQDYGVSFNPGGDIRLRVGQALIKRSSSKCTDSDSGTVYNFGALNVSKWYAGVEIPFGGKSSQVKEVVNSKRDETVVDDLYNRIINSKSEKPLAKNFRPAKLKVEDIRLNDAAKTNGLNAGDSAVVSFRLKNYGGSAVAIKAAVDCDARHISVQRKELELGDIEEGESKRVEIPVASDFALKDGTATLEINFSEWNGNPPDPVSIKFRTFKTIAPKFVIVGMSIDDGTYADKSRLAFGNGNGVLEPGESAELTVLVKNEGGTARSVEVSLNTGEDISGIRSLADDNFAEIYDIGALEHNDWRELKFAVSVSKVLKAIEKFPFKLVVSEQRQRFNAKLDLPIVINETLPMAQRIAIAPIDQLRKKAPPVPTFGRELLSFPEAAFENKDGVAVIIGVKNYSNSSVPSVDYALNDAALIREYAIKALGYQEGNVIYLENPTKADLEKVFGNSENPEGQLYDYIKKGRSDVFVYYTGHGAPDLETKESYLVPSDSDPNYVKLSGYPLKVLYKNVSKMPAKSISVAIDACFSGMSDKGSIITKASPLLVVPTIPGAGRINVFASSRAEEVSSWYPEKRHSLFTYFFLKGLQGAADKNKDKRVTQGELATYVSENVGYYARRLYGRKQNPTFTGNKGETFMRYR